MNLPNLKFCRRCGNPFDIDTSQDYCPKCRNANRDERREKEGNKKCK